MALTYGFYNSQDGDRKYDAVQMSSIFDGIIEDGIFQSIGTAMAVTASTGRTVVVGVGRAWFDHTWTLNDSGYPIELPESEVLLDRIDAVVLEVDASVGVRANSFKIVEGTPASSPQRPSLVDNETTHQHALAYILRKAGTEEVTQADITNVIGTSETPYVTGPLSIITADAMLAQWQSEFDQWFESLEDTLSGDVAANLANQIMQKVDKTSVIDDLDEIAATTEEGYVAGALAVKDLNSKIPKYIGQAGYNGSVPIADIPAGTELLIVAECAISAGSRSSFSWSVIKQESGTCHYMDGFTYSQNYRGAVAITVTTDSVSFWDAWTQFLEGQVSISKSSNNIKVYSK